MKPVEIASYKVLLKHLKSATAGSPLEKDLLVSSSEGGFSATAIKDIWFQEDCAYEWQDFFRNAQNKPHRGWIRISCENFAELDKAARDLFQPLEGMSMHMTASLSWRNTKDEDGNACQKNVLEILCIGPESEMHTTTLSTHKLIDFIESKLPLSSDPRSLYSRWFSMQSNMQEKLFSSYSKHRFGITATFTNKEGIKKATSTIFEGCLVEVIDSAPSKHNVRVIMPDMIEQYKSMKAKKEIATFIDREIATLAATEAIEQAASPTRGMSL